MRCLKLLTFKECVENPEKIVGLRFDRMFKEVFGSLENKELIIYLLSILMDKKEKEIRKNIQMLPERFEMDSVKQKMQARDLAVALVGDKTTQINIELNICEYDEILQDRNMIYLAHFVSHSIASGQDYTKIKNTIQYNLNSHYADPKKPKFDRYVLRKK